MMELSDIFPPLCGGLMIGAAAGLMLFTQGRIAGISGIVGGLLHAPTRRHWGWRVAFLSGLLSVGAAAGAFAPETCAMEISRSGLALALAGVLVGYGTRLGSGCTSGHGVCGIGRFSFRSLVATATFVAVGAATVYVVNHLLGGAV